MSLSSLVSCFRASSPGGSRPKDGKGKEQSKTAQKERKEDPKQKERKEEPKQKEPVKFALPKNQVPNFLNIFLQNMVAGSTTLVVCLTKVL